MEEPVITGAGVRPWRRRFEDRCNFGPHPRGLRFEYPPVFKPADWRSLPIPGGADDAGELFPWYEMEEAHLALCRYRGVSEDVLRANWPPHSPLKHLWAMLRERGVDEIAVTGWGTDLKAVYVGPPSSETLSQAICLSPDTLGLAALECAVTDKSDLWALYSSSFEEVSVLGGEPAFMDEFVQRAGGLAWLQAVHAIKHRSETLGRESFRPLYAQIGWSWPFDADGRPLDGDGA